MTDDTTNTPKKWNLLNRLKTVVKKVTFLMNSNVNRWRLVSAFMGGGRRQLSFGERLGLTAIVSSSDDDDDNNNLECRDVGSCSKQLNKTRSFHVQRTMSFREEEDIDKRAELFIENFYKQLRYQRQVSLELRYKRGPSFGSSESNSNDASP
ncbi:hypothetical protein E3N88_28499 [Mikania micrantha]|uniref:DUF761 domain-containing protein n=1 Tax=Mikania micrantha TaxID=192012 RepID=A0A5N6MZY6_9ASTR|nr:hypothetical protein E3N88_28499 [Mikania micrantha]